jgi:carbamoyl-phosphate synthase large subunit
MPQSGDARGAPWDSEVDVRKLPGAHPVTGLPKIEKSYRAIGRRADYGSSSFNRQMGALNVLVLGVGGNVSQSIQKALAHSTLQTRVHAACISREAAGLYLADRAYISPVAQSSEFIPWVLDVCDRERIGAVLSGSEVVLEALAPAAAEIGERTGARCIVSPPEVLRIGRDKLLTCRWLEAEQLPVPGYAHLEDSRSVEQLIELHGFPLIAKPRFGKGSDGIVTLRDREDLEHLLAAEELSLRAIVDRITASDVILQQYLGDEHHEYTVGCFCASDGGLRGTVVMRRTIKGGTTTSAELGRFPEVRAVAEAIASTLGPLGPCNVQLRMDEGEAVPFEINPRFSGTTALRAQMGFNEVEAALRHFVLGEPAPTLADVGSGFALRYWNEVYVPADAVIEVGRNGRLADPRAHEASIEDWGLDR